MTKNIKKISIRLTAIAASLVLIAAACLLGFTQGAYAADASYGTKEFSVNVVANENNSFDIQEDIKVDFWYPHHGIYRYIPDNGVHISQIGVPGYEWDSWHESGNEVLQIGSGDYTLDGINDYRITYKMTAYDDQDESLDRLMLNVIPTGWETTIDHASATIKLPKEADLSKIQLYTGEAWSEENAIDATAKAGSDGKTIYVEAYDVPAHNGITVIVELPEGYWTGERVPGAVSPWVLFLLLLGPVGAAVVWFFTGRDKHMVKTIEFYPPNDLTPGEIGFIIDESADKCDIVSSIVYLANKGYITIEEESDHDYKFTKKKEIKDNEPAYIQDIYEGLFKHGSETYSSDLGTDFGRKYQEAVNDLEARFSSSRNSVYSLNSRTGRLISMFLTALPAWAFLAWENYSGQNNTMMSRLGMAFFIWASTYCVCSAVDKIHSAKKSKTILRILLAFMWFEFAMMIEVNGSETLMMLSDSKAFIYKMVFVAAELITMFFAVIGLARKPSYTDLMGKILGFKDFIRTAELDKLKELVEDDPSYFYNIMPYAYVFGLSDKWIKNFEHIELPRPDWYVGTRYTYFDGYLMGRMMSNCSANVSHHARIPVDTSGSGVSKSDWFSGGSGGFSGGGGGFSGGGFGGGGGGAW